MAGILSDKHLPEFKKIIEAFKEIGYNVSYKLLNAKDYGVPQDRKRVIIVGYHNKLGKKFEFPQPTNSQVFLKDAIGDLPEPKSAKEKNKTNGVGTTILNNEYMNGGFSSIYMSNDMAGIPLLESGHLYNTSRCNPCRFYSAFFAC